MFFSSNNTTDIMQTTKMDGVLSDVSRAIAKAAGHRKRTNLRPKVQTYDVMQQEDMVDPSPIYTNYWLAQTDPGFVDQDESNTTIIGRRRKNIPNPAEGVKDYLGNWMSPDDVKKALQERFPDGMNERSLYGVHPEGMNERNLYGVPQSMTSTETPLSKIGIGMTDFHYIDVSNHSKRRMERAIKAHWERQIL